MGDHAANGLVENTGWSTEMKGTLNSESDIAVNDGQMPWDCYLLGLGCNG